MAVVSNYVRLIFESVSVKSSLEFKNQSQASPLTIFGEYGGVHLLSATFGPRSCASTVNATVGDWSSSSTLCFIPMFFLKVLNANQGSKKNLLRKSRARHMFLLALKSTPLLEGRFSKFGSNSRP